MTWKDGWGLFARGERGRVSSPEPDGPELSCQELVALVTDYWEDALSAGDRRRFEAHLDGCGGCRAYLEQMRGTILAAGGLAALDLDPAMLERLMEAFREWRSEGGS
jgi:anti-sigma factor RsiW